MIQLNTIDLVINSIPIKKLSDYSFSVDEVIAVQSKYFYAKTKENLGYYTLAQHEQIYRKKVAELIEEFVNLNEKGKNITILELGGGTGKFALSLLENLEERTIQCEYNIVDVSVNQYPETLRKKSNVKIIESSFTNFGLKNKSEFDILIMNEALDMWAGKESLTQLWDTNEIQYKPHWVLFDLEKKSILKKKDLSKIHQEDKTMYVWVEIFENVEKEKLSQTVTIEHATKISLPESFKYLLQKIKLFTLVQDYWSFPDEENPLRMGLFEESVEKTLEKISYLEKDKKQELQISWFQELKKTNEKKFWIQSSFVPLGIVDVTYSPNQSEMFDLGLEFDLEIVNMDTQNLQKGNNYGFTIGEKENEILILFTRHALELQFKKSLL